jgi:DNA mismatch endonuclease (patch repair protein)
MDTPYPHPTSDAARAVMRANRKKNTRPEVAVRRALHAKGFRYRIHLPVRAEGKSVRADIVFPKQKLAVFIDGCFWHSCPVHGNSPRVNTGYWIPKLERNKARDTEVNARLARSGWRVLRIWEHVSADEAVEEIAAAWRAAQ